MAHFYLAPTLSTPEVAMDIKAGKINISGRSTPKNAVLFYSRLLKVAQKLQPEDNTIQADFYLEYFNTSSAKCLFDLLKVLREHKKAGKKVMINWYYEIEDEDMREVGEDYESLLHMDFNYLPSSEIISESVTFATAAC